MRSILYGCIFLGLMACSGGPSGGIPDYSPRVLKIFTNPEGEIAKENSCYEKITVPPLSGVVIRDGIMPTITWDEPPEENVAQFIIIVESTEYHAWHNNIGVIGAGCALGENNNVCVHLVATVSDIDARELKYGLLGNSVQGYNWTHINQSNEIRPEAPADIALAVPCPGGYNHLVPNTLPENNQGGDPAGGHIYTVTIYALDAVFNIDKNLKNLPYDTAEFERVYKYFILESAETQFTFSSPF